MQQEKQFGSSFPDEQPQRAPRIFPLATVSVDVEPVVVVDVEPVVVVDVVNRRSQGRHPRKLAPGRQHRRTPARRSAQHPRHLHHRDAQSVVNVAVDANGRSRWHQRRRLSDVIADVGDDEPPAAPQLSLRPVLAPHGAAERVPRQVLATQAAGHRDQEQDPGCPGEP